MNIFPRFDQFEHRHIGSLGSDLGIMLRTIGVASLDQLIEQTVPASIRRKDKMAIPPAQSEFDFLNDLQKLADENELYRSFLGQGYS